MVILVIRELRTALWAGLSGDGLWGTARDWLRLRARVFRLEIADSHIIGDLMNLTATCHLYYRGTRSEVAHGYVVAEVFYAVVQIGGSPLPGGRNAANRLIFQPGRKCDRSGSGHRYLAGGGWRGLLRTHVRRLRR